jgi:DNA-directed RNA polymerase subunit beta'
MGLKENIIVGQPIPAGTGLRKYSSMVIQSDIGDIYGRENRMYIEEQYESNPEYGNDSELIKGGYYIENEEGDEKSVASSDEKISEENYDSNDSLDIDIDIDQE